MRLTTTFKAIVLATECIPPHDGYKERYQIAIMQGTETATLSCSKEVFESNPEPFKQYGIVLSIRDWKGDYILTVSSVVPISEQTAASSPGTKK